MKPNINDRSKFADVKAALEAKGVSRATIETLDNVLNRGLVVERAADLSFLSIPAAELTLVSSSVTFGASQPEPQDFRTLQFKFLPVHLPDIDPVTGLPGPVDPDVANSFFGYQFVIGYANKQNYTVEEAYPIADSRSVIVDLDLNQILDRSEVVYQVKDPQGEFARIDFVSTAGDPSSGSLTVNKSDLKNAEIKVGVVTTAIKIDAKTGSYQVKGKLLSDDTDEKMEDYQILIAASVIDPAIAPHEYLPVAYARTETGGYFVTSFLQFADAEDIDLVTDAKAIVAKDDFRAEFPIKLVEGKKKALNSDNVEVEVATTRIPQRLILMIDLASREGGAVGEIGGCSELNFHEKKVFEAFSYQTVVRTTEPAIIADVIEEEDEIDLGDIYGEGLSGVRVPRGVFQQFHTIKSRQPMIHAAAAVPDLRATSSTILMRAGMTANPSPDASSPLTSRRPFTEFDARLLDGLMVDYRADKAVQPPNKQRVNKGRAHLTPLNQINWDKATIYQAASIAHGHLLHFKQEWIPDGYSIGDLLYSLPLAPGQKKQIAVLDWERRESAANSQALDYEESLNNTLIRDRDVSEVVSATLNENMTGSSTAKTGGFGFGLGSAVMGVFQGGTYGGLMGISGGKSKASSTASQTSHRDSTANSLQSIRDRTTQAANAVRSQRSTVIQTVSQGERVQATSESVANYNHCHAITIQYFEVVRHFAVHNRFVDAQECLFIPLQITNFDLEKVLRWRDSLERCLFKPALRAGFDALERIQNEKESTTEDYYKSIGYPEKYFAEQQIVSFQGELYMEFYFFNPKNPVDNALIEFFQKFFHLDLKEYHDRTLSDDELARLVGPRTIEFLLDALVIETETGQSLNVDVTLVTPFRQNARLQMSLRQAGPVSIARDRINGIRIRIDEAKVRAEDATDIKLFLDKYMKILVRSGSIRYRTLNFAGTLFNTRIDNDLFVGLDSIFIPTPLNSEELRNPRGEDIDAANNLIHHLNENLEHYHKCLWFHMSDERRFMLLDGIVAPGKANGRSVASVVENRIIGVAGNSLIMPVAPGFQLDPTINSKDPVDLKALYYEEDREPMRISLPTKGVYAEAVMGKCNSCEVKDESRFWRWEESPIPDSPNTQILPLNTDTRRAEPGNLQPKDFPTPVVNIQNAPNAPDPTGLQGLLTLLGKGDAFRDITGLSENQKNALAAFQKSLDTAQSFGKQAAGLAKTAGMMELIKNAQEKGSISKDQAQEKSGKVLDAGTPPTFEEQVSRTQKQLEMLKDAFDSGNIDSEQLNSLSEAVIKDATSGRSEGVTPNDVSRMTQDAKQNQANVKMKTEGGEVEIDTQPRRLKRLTRDGVEEVEEISGGFVPDGSLFEQPASPAQLVTITIKNRFNEEVVRNCPVSIEGQAVAGVTNNQGVVRLDLSAMADGDYKLNVTPADVNPAATYSGLGDPAGNPPDRIWESFSATITKQGNLFTSPGPHLGIIGNRMTVRLKPEFMKTPNQIARPAGVDPTLIIVHHTGSARAGTAMNGPLSSLMNAAAANRAGAHYIIDREGAIVKLAHESRDANQAGKSHWGGQDSVGAFSIGIEIVHSNNGPNGEEEQYVEDFTSEQYDSLLLLLTDITQAFDIAPHRVVGHSDVGLNTAGTRLGRKSTDPGRLFDWVKLEANGFGLFPSGGIVDVDTEYGGFFNEFPASSLRRGDRDNGHVYGGVARPTITANVITNLQTDLRTIGYFCPSTGRYDDATAWTVHMFNEHFFSGSRHVAGKNLERVDLDTANTIAGVVRTLQNP
jgi:N-acetyl-anhydromuramyl-L-alanine amidase AmpD